MTTTLANIRPGNKVKIVRIRGVTPTIRRLADMGVVRNTVVTVQSIAPLGDPIGIKIRGYNLALRKVEAEGIEVQEIIEQPRHQVSQ
ncbi:MAG: ferrous iron transport protein A [Planctomycetota bacterium]|nr:MAG: ferrous iron transport protein A [Planctomycetota bacterium]